MRASDPPVGRTSARSIPVLHIERGSQATLESPVARDCSIPENISRTAIRQATTKSKEKVKNPARTRKIRFAREWRIVASGMGTSRSLGGRRSQVLARRYQIEAKPEKKFPVDSTRSVAPGVLSGASRTISGGEGVADAPSGRGDACGSAD